MPNLSRDKVRGMMLGVGIGDALGMPLEGFPASRILAEHPGGLRSYISGDGHKHWNGTPAGTTTDDTGFTKVVMRSLLDAGKPDMDSQARHHVAAFDLVGGMGKTTKEATRKLANNVSWKESGMGNTPGAGNGLPMKIGPVAAFMAVHPNEPINEWLVQFSAMTHNTKMAAISAVVHAQVLYECLRRNPEEYKPTYDLIDVAVTMSQPELFTNDSMNRFDVGHLKDTPDDINVPFSMLRNVLEEGWDGERIGKEFGGVGRQCYYVYYSLPFTYAHFLKDPFSLETLFAVLNAGGDVDTNASMVGGMLGALNGASIFPEELQKGCRDYQELVDLTDAFCDRFGVTS